MSSLFFPQSTIFIASNSVPVYWAHMSVLDADLICLRQLLRADPDWKMWFNPASTELPLVTIGEFRRRVRGAGGNIVNQWRGNGFRQIKCYELRRYYI